jgi:hypothetical protein
MNNALSLLSEIELVKMYRKSSDFKEKSKIFESILFVPRNNKKSWHQYIQNHAQENAYKVGYCTVLDVNDLYQEICYAFLKMISSWFDLKSSSFSTYAWYCINSYTDRVFQSSNTHKRKVHPRMIVEINSVCNENENRTFSEVISDQDIGSFRTIEKSKSFEDDIFNKNLYEFLLDFFKPLKIDASEALTNELTALIKNKYDTKQVLNNIMIKYELTLKQLENLKEQINKNIRKEIFREIIILMKKDVKSDNILAKKFNCSIGQISKMKKELPEIIRKKMKEIDLSICDVCF